MSKKSKIIAAIIILLGISAIIWIVYSRMPAPNKKPVNLNSFAKCLKDKGVVMYGAYWCPHCQKQKKEFGDSFKFVNYVECTKEVKKCTDKKVEGYPTWIFKNGQRITGEANFEELAKKSGCKIQ